MKTKYKAIMIAALLTTGACKKDSDYLNVPPKQVIPTETLFSDPVLVLSALANLYSRQLDFSSLDDGWATFADFSEAFPSENSDNARTIVQRTSWGYGEWSNWDYTYIRELNLFIQRATASTKLSDADKARFLAEARFLRANFYFELVKRMGGVPIVTEASEDIESPVSLQKPRSKESDVYDFIISEAETIKDILPTNADEKGRATKGAALAMETRAALYAGSIAKYGTKTPQVTLPGNEVGIPSAMASGYYTKALATAQQIINGSAGAYSLYQRLPDLSENFAAIFYDKTTQNRESIFIEDFKIGTQKKHSFTVNDQPYSSREEGSDAGRLNPSLNLVESFEKLDNTFAPLATTDGSGNPIYYTNPKDIFAGRDARLAGTVITPGSTFKAQPLDIWAGYQLANGNIFSSADATILQKLPGTDVDVQVIGSDGPANGKEFRTQTGFYVRKYLDPSIGSGRRGTGSDVPFIRYRYAEVLLNACEAAFELGQSGLALIYINQVRSRAGLTTPLATLTFDRIVHERRAELVFEGHTLYDMKRWRLAHVVWDGKQMTVADLKSDIGSATKRNTQPYGLWPYKYYNPGNANNGKWLFKEVRPSTVTGFNNFRLGNYYSQINNDILSANPKLVKQPNQ